MKRIILSVMVLAFAVAVQAGDAKKVQDKDKGQPACCASKVKTSNPEQPACCASKVKTSAEAKGTCPAGKSGCCKKKAVVKQTGLLSPKAIDTIK